MEEEEVDDDLPDPLVAALQQREPIEVIGEILRRDPHSIQGIDLYGWRPLHHAVHNEASVDVITLLVDAWEGSLVEGTDDWSVPLHYAVSSRGGSRLEVVAFLIERCPEALQEKDCRGQLPLHCAIQGGASPDVVRCLVHAHPTALQTKDEKGRLPLHLAVLKGDPFGDEEVVQCLVERCPEALLEKDDAGWIPLHVALRYRSPRGVVRRLVDGCPRSLQERDERGFLPLHFAVHHGAPVEVIQLLVDEGPDDTLLERDTDRGYLPLHVAARRQAPWVVIHPHGGVGATKSHVREIMTNRTSTYK